MLATVSPNDYQETLSTLRYASKASKIRNTPKRNVDRNSMIIHELRGEIARLNGLISQKSQAPRREAIHSSDLDLFESVEPALRRRDSLMSVTSSIRLARNRKPSNDTFSESFTISADVSECASRAEGRLYKILSCIELYSAVEMFRAIIQNYRPVKEANIIAEMEGIDVLFELCISGN